MALVLMPVRIYAAVKSKNPPLAELNVRAGGTLTQLAPAVSPGAAVAIDRFRGKLTWS